MGTDSCYVVDPGDFSYEIAFGYNATYCTVVRGIDPSSFYELTEDRELYTGKNFSWYSVAGDIAKGNSQLNFSFIHVYTNPGEYKVRIEFYPV